MTSLPFIRRWLVASLIGGAMVVARADTPAPEVMLSLSGLSQGRLESGMPLFVSVRVEAPAEGDAKLVLAPTTGKWSDAVTVELTPATGGNAALRAKRVGPGAEEGPQTLDAEQAAEGLWLFSSAELGSLPPGGYRVQARLAIAGSSGWNGAVVGDEAVKLVAVATNPSPEQLDRRALGLANEAMAVGDFPRAARLLDERLSADPDNVELLQARALLCLRGENLIAANACVNRALARVARERWPHPPQELYALSGAITQTMLSGESSGVGPPPVWSVPPASVLAPVREGKATPAAAATATGATTTAAATTAPAAASAAAPVPNPAAAPVAAVATAPAAVTAGVASVGVLVPAGELSETTILADAAVQWATRATASSEYGTARYSAGQATGAPDIPLGLAGDNPEAWCPAQKDAGSAWLELAFANPVHATEVRVRQNNAPGAITKVEAVTPDGAVHLWWEGVDPYVAPRVREIAWFAVRVPKTDYLVTKVKVTLNLTTVPGWKQIDAVQLVGTP